MPKLIVTSRYLKKGAVKKLQNYVKYIATREGSVPVKENSGNDPATQKQCELIISLLREFPDSIQTFAYEDYSKAATQKNASALISEIVENNADIISERENYIGYLANRPGAVKFDTHALFSQEDTPIDLNAVAKEIANHGGNVWTHVVALRRDNAQQMGYDNLIAWRELVKRQIPNIAKAQKMDVHKEIAKLREQNHVIARLRTKGFMDEGKYQEQSKELNNKVKKLQAELRKITRSDDEDDVLEQLDMLVDYFEKRDQMMVSFEPETFDMMVDRITANQNELTFHLLGGIELKEKI